MSRRLIDIRERDIIRDNIDLPTADICKLIMDETGIVVSTSAITRTIKNMRESVDSQKELVASTVEKNITTYINERSNKYLEMLDNNINDINNILESWDLNEEEDRELYLKYTKALGDQISTMLKLAPKSNTDTSTKLTLHADVTKSFEEYLQSVTNVTPTNTNINEEIKTVQTEDYKLID